MISYDAKTYISNEQIEGHGPWRWIHNDHTWQIIRNDWVNGHRARIADLAGKRFSAVCAGGNQGMYPKLLASMFGTVYTFEPDPLNFHCLAANCQEDNIIKIQAALGDRHTLVSMYHRAPGNAGMHQIVPDTGTIPMLMLDDFQFSNLRFILFDMENSELPALRGAVKTIAQHKPVIFAEFSQETGIPVRDFLTKECGYKVDGKVGMDEIYVPA